MLAVGNSCYVAVCSVAQGASAPTAEERGGGISWQPPALDVLSVSHAGSCVSVDSVLIKVTATSNDHDK